MDQLICASLSHNHYWYEVVIDYSMLKVPAILIDGDSRGEPRLLFYAVDRGLSILSNKRQGGGGSLKESNT